MLMSTLFCFILFYFIFLAIIYTLELHICVPMQYKDRSIVGIVRTVYGKRQKMQNECFVFCFFLEILFFAQTPNNCFDKKYIISVN